MLRRAIAVLSMLACLSVVIAYQATRPARPPADARVFVPSPRFFIDFAPGFRTSIADAYYLGMVQYYGQHVNSDGRLDALPAMVDLVTALSPHFERAYLFGAFALIDAGRPDLGYKVLQRGFEANPENYRFPAYLGFFAYRYGRGKDKDIVAAQWYQRAATIPGSPAYLPRLAATLLGKGGELEKAVVMWGQVYMGGDKYARQRAVDGLQVVLPRAKGARMRAVAPLFDTMPRKDFEALTGELFRGYGQ
jgi:hypothetical protein